MKPTINYHDDLIHRLKEPRYAAAYLSKCMEDDDESVFLLALRDVAEAHGGLRPLAKKTNLNREHLFRMLSRTGNPQLHNLRQLVDAMGMKLVLRPV